MTKFLHTILYDFIYTNMTLIYEYESFILIGDLNLEPTESALRDFCEIYKL